MGPVQQVKRGFRDHFGTTRTSVASVIVRLVNGKPAILLEGDPADYESTIETALKQIDPHGRLTLTRIANYLFQRILYRVRDIATAAFITRNDHTLASSKLFYSSFQVSYLRRVYQMVLDDVCSELTEGGYTFARVDAIREEDNDGSCVGSPLCPTLETIRFAIKRLKKDIRRMLNSANPDLKQLSDLVSFYVYLWFSCEIAARGVEGCYIPDEELDALAKAADLRGRTTSHIDKSDAAGTHGRLYSIGQELLDQMVSFREFRNWIDDELFNGVSSGLPIYFIREQDERVVVCPKNLKPFLEQYLPFPANFARHLLRSEQVERYVMEGPEAGLPIEFLDCLLGHWNIGEEPGGEYSTFPYRQYFAAVEKCIPSFVASLGFRPISIARSSAVGSAA
jgi:hypothetical protein